MAENKNDNFEYQKNGQSIEDNFSRKSPNPTVPTFNLISDDDESRNSGDSCKTPDCTNTDDEAEMESRFVGDDNNDESGGRKPERAKQPKHISKLRYQSQSYFL